MTGAEQRRFRGTTPLGRRLCEHREGVISLLANHGMTNVRVFGSTARGDDDFDSDIDLLVTANPAPSLFGLARAELDVADLLGAPVDLVPDRALRPDLRANIMMEAVEL
ncbi:MAG: nucleotidyltransferase family protein [Schaalia sp.]|jgi:hypothetical protein